jgi:hypothetical protein
VDVQIHIFFASALAGGEWSASRSGRFTPGYRTPGTYCIGGWVDPRAGLDDVEKRKFLTLPGLKLRPLGRPACSPSLYRIRCPGSCNPHRTTQIQTKRRHPHLEKDSNPRSQCSSGRRILCLTSRSHCDRRG